MRATLALMVVWLAFLALGLHYGLGAEHRFEHRFCSDPAVCATP